MKYSVKIPSQRGCTCSKKETVKGYNLSNDIVKCGWRLVSRYLVPRRRADMLEIICLLAQRVEGCM